MYSFPGVNILLHALLKRPLLPSRDRNLWRFILARALLFSSAQVIFLPDVAVRSVLFRFLLLNQRKIVRKTKMSFRHAVADVDASNYALQIRNEFSAIFCKPESHKRVWFEHSHARAQLMGTCRGCKKEHHAQMTRVLSFCRSLLLRMLLICLSGADHLV